MSRVFLPFFNPFYFCFTQVVRAIRALLENGVQAAPIWHATTQRVTGLFSQDFALHLLASLYNYGSNADHRDQLTNSPSCPSSPDAGAVDRPAHSSPTSQSTVSVTDGLKIWGSRRLNDILRKCYVDIMSQNMTTNGFHTWLNRVRYGNDEC